MAMTKSAKVRSQLKHPIVDADGHWLELYPVFLDYIAEIGGVKTADAYTEVLRNAPGFGGNNLITAETRWKQRNRRQGWWGLPTDTKYRTACMVPGLCYDTLDDWGIDVMLLYPTLGFSLLGILKDPDLRQAVVRAYNTMVADMFKPYGDRMIASAVISLETPSEALELLEHAQSLGHKLLVMNGASQRPIEADTDIPVNKRRYYFDSFGIDSPYNYDPVWQKLVDMKAALTVHTGTQGWPDRSSPTSFVFNHMGHFAQSHHITARGLFMGGVTQRFPKLNVGFLEGGVGWACTLYGDIFGHWKKRNRPFMQKHCDPMLLDRKEVKRLMQKYVGDNKRWAGKIDEILANNLETPEPNVSQEALSKRDRKSDDFDRVSIKSARDIRKLYAGNFYFGCEADDPMTVMAFNEQAGLKLKAMMGSDIGHFDVPDATEVIEEAWEMVEHGLITEENFREFTLTNAVELHAGMNPDFFKGTVIEKLVPAELKRARARKF